MLNLKTKCEIDAACKQYFKNPFAYDSVNITRRGHSVFDGGIAVIMYVDPTDQKTYAETRSDARYAWYDEYISEHVKYAPELSRDVIASIERDAEERCFERRNVKSLDEFLRYVYREFVLSYSERALDELEVIVDKRDNAVECFTINGRLVVAC